MRNNLNRTSSDSSETPEQIDQSRRKLVIGGGLALAMIGAAPVLKRWLDGMESDRNRDSAPERSIPRNQGPALEESPDQETAKFIEGANAFLKAFYAKAKAGLRTTREHYWRNDFAEDENIRNKAGFVEKIYDEIYRISAVAKTLRFPNSSLRLSNIVFNETSSRDPHAANAIVHAWLNRIGEEAREPQGAEISHYQGLVERFDSLASDTEKFSFLTALFRIAPIAESVLAMNQTERQEADPTQGATHWVSPRSLPEHDPGDGRYPRTVWIDGKQKIVYFPNWARRTNDSFVQQSLQRNLHFNRNFAEIKAANVSPEDFYFYRGVRY